MIKEKLLRDPIHDLIAFDLGSAEDRVLVAAMDTAEVQRLRRVKQLGMAHMAYQGAEHSRFTHSIGVMHLIRRMLGRLAPGEELDAETRLSAMCAGLLHDVGHGPFSHVMEKFFREEHETWSKRVILDPSTEINAVLVAYSPTLPAKVVALLDGEATPRWLNALVSSQMDADRFDYLLRDSHMTGVKYGIFDLERLLLLLRVSEDGEKIVVAAKGLLPVEKYLQSRYQMYRQVYFHKTVTAAEAMLMSLMDRARELAMDDRLPAIYPGPLLRLLRNEALDIGDFLALDDSVLLNAMNLWSRCEEPILADLSRRLLTRKLFKSLEIEADEEADMLFDAKLMAARDALERHGFDFRYYLRLSKSKDTPYRPYSSRGGSAIWIQEEGDPARLHDVKEVSPTIRAFTESPYTIHRVFFPGESPELRAEMGRILKG